jgi:hypothetical protein
MPALYQNPAMASYPTPSPQEVNTGLVCLLSLAQYFGLAADGEQLRHEFGLSAGVACKSLHGAPWCQSGTIYSLTRATDAVCLLRRMSILKACRLLVLNAIY